MDRAAAYCTLTAWHCAPRCRYTRAAVKAVADGASADAPQETLLVVMGEKGRSQLQRDMRSEIYATIAGGCRAVAVQQLLVA